MHTPKIIIFTGAGLSADSGIATYRGSEKIDGVPYEEIMNSKTLAQRPELVHGLCDDRRAELASVEPNAAHRMIAELAATYGSRLVHITQNIDDLVERAGFEGSLHVHGHLTRMRSIGNSKVEIDIGHRRYWSGISDEAPEGGYRFRCPRSGSLFRPGVVLFRHLLYDEPAPLYPLMHKIMNRIQPSDLLVVIGTEGAVLPVGRWASKADCSKVLNNLHDSPEIDSGSFGIYLKEAAASAADKILQIAHDHMAGFSAAP